MVLLCCSAKVRKVLTALSLWRRNRLRKGYFWPVRIGVRHTGISLGYLLNGAVVFRVILYDFVSIRIVEEEIANFGALSIGQLLSALFGRLRKRNKRF
jgi:hypothetical protein